LIEFIDIMFLGENLFKEKVFPEPLSKTFFNREYYYAYIDRDDESIESKAV